MEIDGRGALVTGASRGLGRALARALARRGARLALVARDEKALWLVVDEIRGEGGEAHAIPADVGDKHAVYPIAGAAAALAGPIDIAIHNASTLGAVPLRLLLDTDCEDLERVLAVNLVGPFRLTKALAGGMLVRGSGVVVFVSSDAAVSAYPRWGAYSASKAAQDHLSRVFAAEFEGTPVRFLSVDPGEMDTRMHRDACPDADPSALADPALVARRIVSLIETAEAAPSGARLLAQTSEALP
ncbi:SDR family oxidoreductase [bacterium]|nr:SDR family oxidoreductase [bacterium]